ncbi:MAG TPA: zinc-dependent alcohol dehydrogenase family protein [Gemmatimonadaceae bacterium]|nr:zinc-dependent alcohol dehydrogenase family protein [Gemmatimonadaceae bacterium]
MTAWVLSALGSDGVFERAELPVPALQPGHVIVRVAATSVNPADMKIRDGRSAALAPPTPMVLQMDVAGTVVAAADDVRALAVGDEVFGCAGGVRGTAGALADYMLADARLLARKPASLSLRESASLPLVALTAWEGLRWKTRIEPGQRVWVHGATGGVGHIAIQLAARDGAEVTATASTAKKLRIARELGATHAVNYREEPTADFTHRLTGGAGFDVVVDTVGGEMLVHALSAARPNGRVVSTVTRGTFDLGPMMSKALSLHSVLMLLPLLSGEGRERHAAMLVEIAAAVDDGWLRPLIDEAAFTFDDVTAAYRRAASGDQVGKVVMSHPDGAG